MTGPPIASSVLDAREVGPDPSTYEQEDSAQCQLESPSTASAVSDAAFFESPMSRTPTSRSWRSTISPTRPRWRTCCATTPSTERFPGTVESTAGELALAGRPIRALARAQALQAALGELGVDVVIESTGRFRTRAAAAEHLDGGRPQGDHLRAGQGHGAVDATVVLGVNFEEVYDPERHHIISNASCTTNCLAPVAKVLHETVGIRHGLMTHDPCLHRRPEPARRTAQGPAPGPRGGAEPRSHLDRGREGARARDPRARRPAGRDRDPRADADRLDRRPHGRGRAGDQRRGDQRRRFAAPPSTARCTASSPTARTRSSRATSSGPPTPRSSTRS